MTIHYNVEFKLYHNNSGLGDNGTITHSYKCETLEEAQLIKNRLNRLYDLEDNISENDEDYVWLKDEIIFDYTVCGGYLNSTAEIYKITKTKI